MQSGSISFKQASMDINVKISADKTISLKVQASDTVEDVKKKIEAEEKIPVDRQRLIFSGKQFK